MRSADRLLKKNDLLLAGALLAAALLVMLVLRLRAPGGERAEVYSDGTLYLTADLNVDAVYEVPAADGGFNTVSVEHGEVRVREADCPDCLCVRQGFIGRDGQSIICLPHRLVVHVRGGQGDDVDSVVY